MKRSLVALVVLALFVAACATAPAAPSVSGVISKIDGNTVTITPAGGGSESTVTVGWGTQVYQPNGLIASGTSVLAAGQSVQVWLSNGTQSAARINIQ